MNDTPETNEAHLFETGRVSVDFARRLERERDQYAAILCDAMRWVYACEVTNQNRADMIERFESLELTPSLSRQEKQQEPQ